MMRPFWNSPLTSPSSLWNSYENEPLIARSWPFRFSSLADKIVPATPNKKKNLIKTNRACTLTLMRFSYKWEFLQCFASVWIPHYLPAQRPLNDLKDVFDAIKFFIRVIPLRPFQYSMKGRSGPASTTSPRVKLEYQSFESIDDARHGAARRY